MDVPEGCLLPTARAMKAGVPIPVIAAGRINSLALAERALANADADFIHMGRAFHADPQIYVKSLRGAEAEVISCIACNKWAAGIEFHIIGDAAWPREAYDAILDGARLGRAI